METYTKMQVGGYTLHLYCDNEDFEHEWNEFPHIFCEEKGATCRKMARMEGWLLRPDGKDLCPHCSGKK